MSYFEANFIHHSDYEAFETSRLLEEEIIEDETYQGMFMLGANNQGWEAAQLPVEVQRKVLLEPGICLAQLALKNGKMVTTVECSASLGNGYWTDVTRQIAINGIAVTAGYFKRTSIAAELTVQESEVSLPSPNPNLVLV